MYEWATGYERYWLDRVDQDDHAEALEGAMNEGLSEGEPPRVLSDRLKLYLADTLESPNAAPPGGLTLSHKALTQEHEAARKVKQGGDILVCLGNPPYDRVQRAEDGTKPNKGGWVLLGDRGQGKIDLKTATVEGGDHKERPIFEDFLEPSRKAGKGLYL